jgi:hypothetical protein
VTLLLAAALAACAPEPEPRSIIDFMDDGLAREGVLIRCNRNREETLTDAECANARRAATAVALRAERERAPALEQESEAKLLALRERAALQAGAAQAVADAAYEARGRDPAVPRSNGATSSSAPAFGAPVGTVMPSMSSAQSFAVYAEDTDPLGRISFEVAAAEPPPNDFVIASPRLEIADLTAIPRPFHTDVTEQ